MPGSYAHITLVNQASEKRGPQKIIGFPREAVRCCWPTAEFLELGCISPDYPYLDVISGDLKKWADSMHYTHTCQANFYRADLFVGCRRVSRGINAFPGSWDTPPTSLRICVSTLLWSLKVGSYKGMRLRIDAAKCTRTLISLGG